MLKNLPNLLTLFNLLCGCMSIVCSFSGYLQCAALLIGIAAVFDFFDGFMARILKAHSEFGKQLDSLSDLVSFGVAPSVIMYQLIINSKHLPVYMLMDFNIVPFMAFFVAAFSALRLAKFNIDTRQTDGFIGLPTPANAILIASFPLILSRCEFESGIFCEIAVPVLENFYFLLIISVVLSLLLISEMPFLSLKFKNFSLEDNVWRYILVLFAIISIVLFGFLAIPLIIFFYLLLSFSIRFFNKT